MRPSSRWRAGLGLVLVLAAALSVLHTASARAADSDPPGFRGIDVVQIQGLIDPANAALIRDSIGAAERRAATAVVLQIDSSGAVGTDPVALARVVRAARVPVVAWIGPSGASVRGGAQLVAQAAPIVSMAANARMGPLTPLRLDRPGAALGAQELVALPIAPARAADVLRTDQQRLGATAALRERVADRVDNVLREVLQNLDGRTVTTAAGPALLRVLAVDPKTGARNLNQDVRFRKLALSGQLQHTLASPWVAYFLFLVGGALVAFEFFTISIGLAGGTGAVSLIGASYGFSVLPVRLGAVALLVLAIVGFSIDVQAGGLGPWTIIATAALVAGSIFLYDGGARLRPAWWTIVVVCLGVVLFMVGGMTAMLRSRFSTPTVGREGMIGELGSAEVAVAPDGVVRVRDALWRARTNRATPVGAGDTVRVVSVDGLVLEVEPEAGGARDHRDRARRS